MRIRFGRRAGIAALAVFSVALALTFVDLDPVWAAKGGGKPGGEAAGNNLSFPVIWSEGVTKALRGTFGETDLSGGVWYWWGIDADGNPEACEANATDTDFCNDDGEVGPEPCGGWVRDEETGEILGALDPDCMLVYPQQDSLNTWQARSLSMKDEFGSYTDVLNVHWIDWGDNLESVDWYTTSQVRAEVVLFQDLDPLAPMLQYDMKHLYGLGIDELWGLATTGVSHTDPEAVELDGLQATVYSHCARLVIQKLTTTRDDPNLTLAWNPTTNIWEGDANPSLFAQDMVVWEGGDGPGYYSAEINVKGKIIYGYTWNVRRLNDGPGDYRITFNLDENDCPMPLNTFFDAGTQIVPISEEEITTEEADDGGDTGGATAYIDTVNNLTYMDVRILQRSGGKDKVKTK